MFGFHIIVVNVNASFVVAAVFVEYKDDAFDVVSGDEKLHLLSGGGCLRGCVGVISEYARSSGDYEAVAVVDVKLFEDKLVDLFGEAAV